MQATILENQSIQPLTTIQTALPWRILRCESGTEFAVQNELGRRDITAFVPSYQHIKRFPDRKPQAVSRALFAGYVLCAMARMQLVDALTVPRVYKLLRNGPEDAIIEPEEMRRLYALNQAAGIEPWERLTTGDRIRIIAGPLRGGEGRVIERKGLVKLSLEVSFLMRTVKVSLDGFDVERF